MSDLIEQKADTLGELPDAASIPVRFWWLKRLLIGGGAFLLFLVAVRLWWGWEAHRRFQAEIDKCIAAGEPVYPADFNPNEPIPDDRNAAKFLMDAAVAINLTNEQRQLIDDVLDRRTVPSEQVEDLTGIISANAAALDLTRQARSRPEVDWGLRFMTPAINTRLPHLSGQRNLSRLLATSAAGMHAAGDDSETLETMLDLWALADALDTDRILICHRIAIQSRTQALRILESWLPTLVVAGSGDLARLAERSPVTRARLRHLIDKLLTENEYRNALQNAIIGERMLQLDLGRAILDRKVSIASLWTWTPAPPAYGNAALLVLYTPTIRLGAASWMRFMSETLRASKAHDWRNAVSLMPDVPEEMTGVRALVQPTNLSYSLEGPIKSHFRHLAERRLAAVAVTVRLYEIDHGHRPAALAELVPEYMDLLPADPFAADGRPIGYAPNADPPVLYSIGLDGVDDKGAFKLPQNRWADFETLDIPFFLNGDRPGRGE